MQDSVFSIANLVPDLSTIAAGEFGTPHGLSASIVLILWVVAGSFLVFSFRKYFQSTRHIKFYIKLLVDQTQEQLAANQRDITQKALENKQYGYLWREFDETLVTSADGVRLFNTLDASHFFNASSLSQGLTENRLLAAVPGFLTAIGVIGTFAGLQMGLASLELSQDAGVEVLQQGIGSMISGASVAFLTSVWGVTTSVVFNFLEKFLERGVRKRVQQLQNRVDYLYPRINAEQSLVTIADHTRNSNETLQCLAEKIGDRLQEALTQTSDTIRTGLEDCLNQIMGPAISSLVENAQNGSQKALDGLLDKFMTGIGDAGSSQREMMDAASTEVNQAVGELGQQLSTFLGSLDEQNKINEKLSNDRQGFLEEQIRVMTEEQSGRQQELGEQFKVISSTLVSRLSHQQEEADEREEARGVHFQETIASVVERLEQQQQKSDARELTRGDHFEASVHEVFEKNKESINSIGDEMSKKIAEQEGRDEVRNTAFKETVEDLHQVQSSLTDRVEALVVTQQRAFDKIHQQMTELEHNFSVLAEAHGQAGQEVAGAAKQMNGVTSQLGTLSVNIKQAAETLAVDVAHAAEITSELAKDNRAVSDEMKNVMDGYSLVGENMGEVADKLRDATVHAESGFTAVNQHLDSFKQGLKEHIEELEEQIASMLSGYAERVQGQTVERLNVWNTHTNDYISQMTDAVRTLGSVVDEIETKVGMPA